MEKTPSCVLPVTNGPKPAIGFLPVVTFSAEHPLDAWVIPHLADCGADGFMVSVHYAEHAGAEVLGRCRMPYMIDSGAYLAIKHRMGVSVYSDSVYIGVRNMPIHGVHIHTDDIHSTLCPVRILKSQVGLGARWAITLDIPCSGEHESDHIAMSVDNAVAQAALLATMGANVFLYGAVQGWDVASYRDCTERMRGTGVHGIAVGGLVRYSRNLDALHAIVDACCEAAGGMPVHLLGIGSPDTLESLADRRYPIMSADSSSYIRTGLNTDGPILSRRNSALAACSRSARALASLHNPTLV